MRAVGEGGDDLLRDTRGRSRQASPGVRGQASAFRVVPGRHTVRHDGSFARRGHRCPVGARCSVVRGTARPPAHPGGGAGLHRVRRGRRAAPGLGCAGRQPRALGGPARQRAGPGGLAARRGPPARHAHAARGRLRHRRHVARVSGRARRRRALGVPRLHRGHHARLGPVARPARRQPAVPRRGRGRGVRGRAAAARAVVVAALGGRRGLPRPPRGGPRHPTGAALAAASAVAHTGAPAGGAADRRSGRAHAGRGVRPRAGARSVGAVPRRGPGGGLSPRGPGRAPTRRGRARSPSADR